MSNASGNNVVCGPNDPIILLDQACDERHKTINRIWSKNPNQLRTKEFIPFGTNGCIVYDGHQDIDARDFLIKNKQEKSFLIVLTAKEYERLFEAISDINVDVSVLELDFPIFENIKYHKSPKENYSHLLRRLKKIKKWNLNYNSLSYYFSSVSQFRVERKLRLKSNLDGFFHYLDPSSFQEVFKLKESRSDRCVIALDFNSMFLDCMRGTFPEPKALQYRSKPRKYNGESLFPGMYHVIFEGISDSTAENYLPFRYTVGNESFRFKISNSDSVHAIITHDELCAYQKFFKSTFIVQEITSKETIPHPLINHAESVYKKRLNYKKQGASELQRLARYELQMMHSCTSIRTKSRDHFWSNGDFFRWLEIKYWALFPKDRGTKLARLTSLLKKRSIQLQQQAGNLTAFSDDFFSSHNVHCLSRVVVAKARVKMFSVIRRFQCMDDVSICYANVDSIHVSVKKSSVDLFLNEIGDLVGDEAGKFKIESIADQGYWLDVGRYWLFRDGKVAAFKNSTLHHKGAKTPFTYARTIKRLIVSDAFGHVKKIRVTIPSLLSFRKKIGCTRDESNINFERFNYSDIESSEHAKRTLQEEEDRSKDLKARIIQEIFCSEHQMPNR